MGRVLKRISSYFSAGAAGGLAAGCLLWALGAYGITAAMNVGIAPRLSLHWLYPKIVWGGIWAQLLLLPLIKSRPLGRGLVISLGPTAYQLFYAFPVVLGKGLFGLKLGTFTPLVIFVVNAVWGLVTVFWLKWTDRSS